MAKKCPREGTRVRYAPNPASHVLYAPGMRRAQGDTGEVTSLPIGSKRSTCMPGPGGGLVYVKWDDGSTVGVSPIDLVKEKGGKKSLGSIGPDGKDVLKKYGKCVRKCRAAEPQTVPECVDRCVGAQVNWFAGFGETEAYEVEDTRSGITKSVVFVSRAKAEEFNRKNSAGFIWKVRLDSQGRIIHGSRQPLDGLAGLGASEERKGVCGWPLVPSTRFPGEMTLSCPKCGGTNITMGVQPGGYGTAPGGRWRMGDRGGSDFVRCETCGEKCVYASKSIGAYQFPSTE